MLTRKALLAVAGAAGLCCSDDVPGKPLGEPCVAHEECASRLCTTPPAKDGGAGGDAGIGKRCAEPGLTP